MSDHSQTTPAPSAPAPEEVEAAMAAHASDELARLQGELAELKAKSADLADQFLRAKAEAENARRRAEEEVSTMQIRLPRPWWLADMAASQVEPSSSSPSDMEL